MKSKKTKGMHLSNPKDMMRNVGKDDMAKNIAIGATGVAIASGVIAAGAALANPKVRSSLARNIEKGIIYAQKMTEEPRQRIVATVHEIARDKSLEPVKGVARMGKAKKSSKAKK